MILGIIKPSLFCKAQIFEETQERKCKIIKKYIIIKYYEKLLV